MSADFVTLGPEAKMQLNSTEFAIVEGRYRLSGDVVETSDSETFPFKHHKVGNIMLELDVTAQLASDVAPHAAPLSIAAPNAGAVNNPGWNNVPFSLWPKGKIGDKYVGVLVVEQFEGNIKVQGSEVQTIKISGKANGAFTVPQF